MASEIDYEALIAEHSRKVADQITKEVALTGTEEDLRITAAHALRDFLQIAKPLDSNIDPKGRHEYHLAKGRPDSVYQGVFIEYKSPGLFQGRKESPGAKGVLKQLRQRFKDFETEERKRPERLLGVGCDGQHWLYIRYRDGKFEESLPTPIDARGTERLLRAFLSLGVTGKSYLPKYLAADFGMAASQSIAFPAVRSFYHAITNTNSPKADVFFRQWTILFAEVCGYDVEGRNPKIEELAKSYVIDPKAVDPARLLFSVHTYYALFMKILASQIISLFAPGFGVSQLHKLLNTRSSNGLLGELKELELRGGIFAQAFNITNFLEGDLFTWYLDCWKEMDDESFRGSAESLDTIVRKLIERLEEYDPASLSAEPTESRDLLKKLYQQLVPQKLRHDLGEYYTPDWLAEHVLNELGYDGDPEKRILDPACGSGTFLVLAIARIRRYFEDHREELRYGEREVLERIERNVIGFDLNPLAVMAARTNYLIAVRDLLRHRGSLAIPVYLCDSIMTPAEHGRSTEDEMFPKPLKLPTSAMKEPFLVPHEVVTSRESLAKYVEILQKCSPEDSGYSYQEFADRCRDAGISITQAELHEQLFKALRRLDSEKKNAIWARIIKNSFAPIFEKAVPFDFVAGNPPWINWESLPTQYRDDMKPLWQDYGLLSRYGSRGAVGRVKKDISMLFVYSCMDHFLKDGGKLGFVITQTVFKTAAGDSFRHLRFEHQNRAVVLSPLVVHDLSSIQVFEGATNRTAVFVCRRDRQSFAYPVRYMTWRGPRRIDQETSLEYVRGMCRVRRVGATHVDPNDRGSPWLTAPASALAGIQKVIGESDYRGYAGCCAWLNGVFWIRILEKLRDGNLLIENLHDVGKIKVEHVQTVIEPDLVYPLLRGRDVQRWQADPSAHIILAQDPQTRKGIPESEMRQKYPKTYDYFKRFEKGLRQRSGFRLYFKPTDPFYSMGDVGPYTLSPWKAMWPELGHTIAAAACGPHPAEADRPALLDHTVIGVSCEGAADAYYICAILNSGASQSAIRGYVALHASPHVLQHIRISRYHSHDPVHRSISQLSGDCHAAAARRDSKTVPALEAEIDKLVAKLWGITDDELKAIQEALKEMERPGRRAKRSADDEEDEAEE
jgi:hypothetical protein